MQTINPEVEFAKTPEKFSKTSGIIRVDRAEDRSGIVLDSLDEVAGALLTYSGGLVLHSKGAALDGALKDMRQDLGDAVAKFIDDAAREGMREQNSRLVYEIIADITASGGNYYKNLEFEAIWTPFFRTTVQVNEVNGKYVLGMVRSYVGSQPENELSEILGKPLAMTHSIGSLVFEIVDDWWFNIDLAKAIGGLPFPRDKVAAYVEYMATERNGGEKPETELYFQGRKLAVSLGLDANTWLRPVNGGFEDSYLQARGNNLVGGAWTNCEGQREIEPRPENPALSILVSYAPENHRRHPAVTPGEVNVLTAARDSILNGHINL